MPRSPKLILSLILICSGNTAMATNVSNPAAVFCVDQGGSYSILDSAEGQRGICKLANGREVDAWSYFRDEHSPNTQVDNSTELANPAATFCIAEGGDYSIVEGKDGQRGICTLPGGREVDAWEYFREKHSSISRLDRAIAAVDQVWIV